MVDIYFARAQTNSRYHQISGGCTVSSKPKRRKVIVKGCLHVWQNIACDNNSARRGYLQRSRESARVWKRRRARRHRRQWWRLVCDGAAELELIGTAAVCT